MTNTLPPIIKLAESVQLSIELAVRGFARRDRNMLGDDLRRQSAAVVHLAWRAWSDKDSRAEWIEQLLWAVVAVKVSLQLGQRSKVFASFGQFEALIRDTESLGRQVAGWKRKHPNGQSEASSATPRRAKTLSAHATSPEVNP